ncbi:hypothetical protein B0J14DRAFT_340369 [Halenospora varia]|nr:hypothetical protein B0J14DRAFT_340369 [Halenospora varia]
MPPKKSKKADKLKNGERSKTAPVSDKNSKFRFEDNPEIEAAGNSPYQLNTPRDLIFQLTDTRGRVWTYSSTQIGQEDWGNKKWIDKVNAWYDQIVTRTCKAPDDKKAPTVKKRAQWSHHEKGYFEHLIRERIKKVGGEIIRRDWEAIAEQQNERWAGRTLRIGEPLVGKTKRGAGVVRHEWIVSRRTWTSLRDILRKWPDTRAVMRQALSELPSNGNDLDDLSDDLRQSIVEQEGGEAKGDEEDTDNEDEENKDEDEGDDDDDDESDDGDQDSVAGVESDGEPSLIQEMRRVQDAMGEEGIQRQLSSRHVIARDLNPDLLRGG